MDEASAWLKRFLSNPSVGLIYETDKSLDQTLEWMRKLRLGRKRILDTHLASILYTNGVSRLLTSNPSDFSIFTDIEVLSPER